MGVITKSSNISDPYPDIEDVFENIGNVEHQHPEPEVRRTRKAKHRSSKLLAIGGVTNPNGKSGKKKKRVENTNYLMSLADQPDETIELSIHDFIPSSISVFTKMFVCRDSFQMWNEFINCTIDNEDWFQKNVGSEESGGLCAITDSNASEMVVSVDKRNEHPAFTAIECFHKIDGDLRHLLKKRRVPIGTLIHFEEEIVTFFVNRPQSVYHCQIPSSFERLMIHAISQYLDLSSLSYDRCGIRWTRVRNKKPDFCLPPVLLSTYLDRRSRNTYH